MQKPVTKSWSTAGSLILNKPELAIIPGITLDDNEPVFNEPWEAQAFALVINLHEKGAFSWNEWADVLSVTIRSERTETEYYKLWLIALETILSQKSVLTDEEVDNRKSQWQRALLATPHGQPVNLENGQAG